MASQSVIGALRIVLGADSATLESDLKKANRTLQQFANQAKAASAIVAVALAGAVAGIGASIKSAIDEAAKLSRLAESVGVPVEELSRLRIAAKLSGVELETLAKSMGILNKNMAAAAAGGISEVDIKSGKAARAFQALGISVRDANGNLKTGDQVLLEMAGKFEGFFDGAGKSALARALLGKGGAALVPLLNQGAIGLKQMMEEADALGLVVGTKTGKAAVEFNNTLLRMKMVTEGLWLQLAEKLLPDLQRLADIMLDARKNSTLMSDAGDILVTSVKGIVAAAIHGATALTNLSAALGALKAVAAAFFSLNPSFETMGAAIKNLDNVVEANAKRLEDSGQRIAALWVDSRVAYEQYDNVIQKKKPFAPQIKGAEDAGKAIDTFLKSKAKALAAEQADLATFGLAAGAKEKARIQLEALSIATENHTRLTDAQQAKVSALGSAFEQVKLRLAGMKLLEEVQPAWVKTNIELDHAAAAMAALGASGAQTQAVFQKIQFPSLTKAIDDALNLKARIDELATSIARNMSSALVDFAMGTKTAEEAFKAFATSVIKMLLEMIIQALIFKAIKMALGIWFADGGIVGGMREGGLVGFPSGGMVSGPGTGTSDSIFARLSNGEFVVNAAATKENLPLLEAINSGDEPAAGSAVSVPQMGGGRTLTVKGFSTREFFRGDQVRDLCENISQHVRDGGRLEVSPA